MRRSEAPRAASKRPTPASKSAPAPARFWLIPAALFAILLVWVFWPNPYGKVRNLKSAGTAVIAFGDSLTAGYGAGPGEDYPSRLSSMIGTQVLNAGVSGDTTDMALERMDADVLARNPRIVIVGLGGNDFLRNVPVATAEQNLRAIIRKIEGAGAMVVLLGFDFPSLSAHWGDMYERVAREEGCLLIGGVLSGILTDPALKSDEIHPNGKGYALMAERIASPLQKLIKRADAARH